MRLKYIDTGHIYHSHRSINVCAKRNIENQQKALYCKKMADCF